MSAVLGNIAATAPREEIAGLFDKMEREITRLQAERTAFARMAAALLQQSFPEEMARLHVTEIRWRCPACGEWRRTLKSPEETGSDAERRVIKDHAECCKTYQTP